MLGLEAQLVFEQNNSTELACIILNIEAILLALDDGMTSRNGNVIDAHLRLMPSSELELTLFGSNCQKMDVSGGVFVEGHRF